MYNYMCRRCLYAHLNMEAEEGDGADDDIIQVSRSAKSQKK
jgi:hypothetical protein